MLRGIENNAYSEYISGYYVLDVVPGQSIVNRTPKVFRRDKFNVTR